MYHQLGRDDDMWQVWGESKPKLVAAVKRFTRLYHVVGLLSDIEQLVARPRWKPIIGLSVIITMILVMYHLSPSWAITSSAVLLSCVNGFWFVQECIGRWAFRLILRIRDGKYGFAMCSFDAEWVLLELALPGRMSLWALLNNYGALSEPFIVEYLKSTTVARQVLHKERAASKRTEPVVTAQTLYAGRAARGIIAAIGRL